MRYLTVVAGLVAGFAAAGPAAVDAQTSAPPMAAAAPGSRSDVDGERADLARAMRAAQDSDVQTELSILSAVIASPAFAQLTSSERHSAYLVAGLADLQTGEGAAAHPLLKAASVMPEALGLDWNGRMLAAVDNGEMDDAVLSLTTLARRFPAGLNQVDDGLVLRLAAEASTSGSAAWRDFARGLLAAGQTARATAVAGRVADPTVIVEMRAEKVFDPIIRGDPGRFDPEAAAARRIALVRAENEAASDRLAGLNALANAFTAAGRDAEALRTLDQALARAASPGDAAPFIDLKEQLIWTRYLRAYALAHLDRHDEAIDQMAQVTHEPDHVQMDQLDLIGLARMYGLVGRSQDALNAVAQVSAPDLSTYGRMQLELTRAIAQAQLGDKSRLAQAITEARPHAVEAPSEFTTLLLVAGDLDGAADLFIERLASPSERADALLDLQDWRIPAGNTAFEREVDRRLKQVRARPDVQAALARDGRIGRYDLNGPTL